MPRGFDWIAPYYDTLARLVFGEGIRRCQLQYLRDIQHGGKVLILGGGTGWILSELTNVNPTCSVCYIDSSSEMLERAKQHVEKQSDVKVLFVHGTENRLQEFEGIQFDAVVANFYFDLFAEVSLRNVLTAVSGTIRPGSKLLVSEFIGRTWWHQLLLFIMYRFFRLTCSIEAKRLPDWQGVIGKSRFSERNTKAFCHGFIISSLYDFEGA